MNHLEIRRILVPTDLSDKALASLHYARFFAEKFGSALTLLYVDPIVFPINETGTPLYIVSTVQHTTDLEKEVRTYANPALAGVPFDVAAVVGQPVVAMIVQEEQERIPDLVIMATHGLRGWRRLILGSVTEGVMRGGSCPVLSVNRSEARIPTSQPFRRILCPINFTDVARASLQYASRLAAAVDAELHVVHIVEEEDPMHAVAAGMDVRSWIDPAVQDRCSYREIVLRGGAAERALDCAEDLDADLIVIGAQHKRFRDESIIGTTTERLVRYARVPVLSIPRLAGREVVAQSDSVMASAG